MKSANFIHFVYFLCFYIEKVNSYDYRQPNRHAQQNEHQKRIENPIGFIGGPDPHDNSKSMYHLYRRYQAYMEYKQGKYTHDQELSDNLRFSCLITLVHDFTLFQNLHI